MGAAVAVLLLWKKSLCKAIRWSRMGAWNTSSCCARLWCSFGCSTYTRTRLALSWTSRKLTLGVASVALSKVSSTSLLPEITPYSAAGASWLAINWPVWEIS
ncbi:hypothetical protein D3C80_1509940 [compost metagenome]